MVSETSLDDLKYGQIVIVNARWLLVVAGFIFLLYRPNNTSELIAGILGVLAIAVINFYLYTRILKKEAVPANWVYLASAIDLGVISLLNYVQGGLGSKAFPFYRPAYYLCTAAWWDYAPSWQSLLSLCLWRQRGGRARQAELYIHLPHLSAGWWSFACAGFPPWYSASRGSLWCHRRYYGRVRRALPESQGLARLILCALQGGCEVVYWYLDGVAGAQCFYGRTRHCLVRAHRRFRCRHGDGFCPAQKGSGQKTAVSNSPIITSVKAKIVIIYSKSNKNPVLAFAFQE